jgi:hypothetical protein
MALRKDDTQNREAFHIFFAKNSTIQQNGNTSATTDNTFVQCLF